MQGSIVEGLKDGRANHFLVEVGIHSDSDIGFLVGTLEDHECQLVSHLIEFVKFPFDEDAEAGCHAALSQRTGHEM